MDYRLEAAEEHAIARPPPTTSCEQEDARACPDPAAIVTARGWPRRWRHVIVSTINRTRVPCVGRARCGYLLRRCPRTHAPIEFIRPSELPPGRAPPDSNRRCRGPRYDPFERHARLVTDPRELPDTPAQTGRGLTPRHDRRRRHPVRPRRYAPRHRAGHGRGAEYLLGENGREPLEFSTARAFVSHGAARLVRLGFADPVPKFSNDCASALAIYADHASGCDGLRGHRRGARRTRASGKPWAWSPTSRAQLTTPLLRALDLDARRRVVSGDTWPKRSRSPTLAPPRIGCHGTLRLRGRAERDIGGSRRPHDDRCAAYGYVGRRSLNLWSPHAVIRTRANCSAGSPQRITRRATRTARATLATGSAVVSTGAWPWLLLAASAAAATIGWLVGRRRVLRSSSSSPRVERSSRHRPMSRASATTLDLALERLRAGFDVMAGQALRRQRNVPRPRQPAPRSASWAMHQLSEREVGRVAAHADSRRAAAHARAIRIEGTRRVVRRAAELRSKASLSGRQSSSGKRATSSRRCGAEVRGRVWGEMTRALVELAGMLEHCDFDEQVHVVGDDATCAPT